MNKVIAKENLGKNVVRFEIEAPLISRKRQPGNFVIVKIGRKGERIPLTITGSDAEKGTISLIVQIVGVSSHKIASLKVGETVTDVVGPLGRPTHIEKVGTVLCAGGGVGIAPLLPIAEAFHEAGNRIVTVLAARTKELVILEKEMRAFSDELLVMTDDGSQGMKGLITEGMEQIIRRETIHKAVTIGPAIMMKYTSLLTKKYNIPTIASLNTIMIDGTGMCGACRVTVAGQRKFACIDGPEFNAHEVDFDELLIRLAGYKKEEKYNYGEFLKGKVAN
ncbi:MAG: sulfide/dihydroorotate dehydrogenase-like FAD/NAD-binding protein [Bacteroidales bacterium]|nr:sulfide/dihydroorotate dehydrogenase-like FAD/NAD-binding protein [Bacteroidales bacterium]